MTSTAPRNSARYPAWVAALVCAIAGGLVFQFFGNAVRGYIDTGSVFWWWGWQWFNPGSETEHGPLILGLAGWLFWRNLQQQNSATRDSSGADTSNGAAAFAMIVALGAHVLGYMVQQTRLSIVAVLIFTWGVLRLAGGARWGRAAAFPLMLMLFSIPVGVLDAVGFHLRLGVIGVTETIAQWVGIEVVRNGTQLFSPDGSYQYDVAAACSGVRSLMALLALSAVLGYIVLRSPVKRVGVFLLAFPLTFLGNVVRIAAIVLAGELLGQRAGEIVHDWAGFIVFVVVLGGVQLTAAWLARSESNPTTPRPPASSVCNHYGYKLTRRDAWRVALGVVVAAVLVTGGLWRIDHWEVRAAAGVPLAEDGLNPAPLPAFLGTEWIGQTIEVSSVEREILPPDTGFARRLYVSVADRRKQVFLSVVLSGQDRTSIHRPELCLVGQGWSIEGRDSASFEADSGGISVPAAVLQISREVVPPGGARQVVPALFAYWFVGREEVAISTPERLWQTALNRLRLRPDRWAYVVAQTLILPGETEADAHERIQEVVNGTVHNLVPVAPIGKKG